MEVHMRTMSYACHNRGIERSSNSSDHIIQIPIIQARIMAGATISYPHLRPSIQWAWRTFCQRTWPTIIALIAYCPAQNCATCKSDSQDQAVTTSQK